MIDPILLIPVLTSFLLTLVIIPYWIKKARQIKLEWKDMNKPNKPRVVGSGGISVVIGFLLSILIYIAILTFYFKKSENIIELFALTTSVLFIAGIGLVDDLFGWRRGGLSKKVRLILVIFASIPLIVINAGESVISLPFLGRVNFGLLFPLVLIPLGITGAATTFNFLAGMNGLEASQGMIVFLGLGVVTYMTGNSWLSLICLIIILALCGFWIYNKVPAKVFPGDVLTYPLGGLIAIIAILGNIEKIAVFFFIPYILEVVLKSRGGLKKQSFGKPNKDGSLDMLYDKIYGLTHFSIWFLKKIKKKVYENDVVIFINLIQALVIVLGFILFKGSLF
jgi:UDP-N-acetylglucosamine--dolichyl-phosphate N-acetylglucosaminephosphotransferase